MPRWRLMLIGAVLGLTWAASLRGFMREVAGPASTFTFGGTFGIILPSGALTGALLGWSVLAAGRLRRVLIGAPLVLAVVPNVIVGPDSAPVVLALLAMVGGFAFSGRGPVWARLAAGLITLAAVVVPFLASNPYPGLSATTPHGAWVDTLLGGLFVTLALASSLPMRAGPSKLTPWPSS